jgi:hypothetical protein
MDERTQDGKAKTMKEQEIAQLKKSLSQFLKNYIAYKKAFSPVIASLIFFSIILIIILLTPIWTKVLSPKYYLFGTRAPLDKIHFTNDFTEYENRLYKSNISIVMATQINADATFQINNFDNFLMVCQQNNITCVITNYKDNFEIPPIYEANTTYPIEFYSFWFYHDVPNVGKVAVFTNQTLEAYWLGD